MPNVYTKVVYGEEIPALEQGTSNDVHALHRPLGHPRTRHIAHVDVQLQQA